MLTPTVANYISFFYATGNTPATSLTRCIPHGQDAAVLSLGCGDVRNILFTAYLEKGLPKRKIDVTCCDIDDRVIVRNLILLTLIIDGNETATNDFLWDTYYHFYVTEATAEVLHQQIKKLLPSLATLEDWQSSQYGRILKFCDVDTLDDIRRHCKRMALPTAIDNTLKQDAFRNNLNVSRQYRTDAVGKEGSVLTGARSAAPLSLAAMEETPMINHQYWKDGTATPNTGHAGCPNPMFAYLMTQNQVLHYGADPTMGFHLATGFAPLSESSPLKPKDIIPDFKAVSAAKTQFAEWVSTFRQASRRNVIVRFVVADVFAFCHTLQHAAVSQKTCANWYRRQWDAKPLNLDGDAYGRDGNAPALFDMVDTSNLSDHVGALNILISTAPLLKDKLWATIYTDLLIKQQGSECEAFNNLLRGHASTISLLIGVSPVQYWTNAKCESHLDEVNLGLMTKSMGGNATQLHSRLAWKRDDQFSGQPGGRGKLHMQPTAVARILYGVYLQMFEGENLAKSVTSLATTSSAYGHFHRGSFATLLKLVMGRVKTDWPAMCTSLLESIAQDGTLALSSNHMQELTIQLHIQGVRTEPWVLNEVRATTDSGPLKGWKNPPPAVVVTLVVPRQALDRLYAGSPARKKAAPTFAGSLRASSTAVNQWHNMFADVHIVFGTVKTKGAKGSDAFSLTVEEDQMGWSGTSPLIASFLVPTAALQVEPATALAGICVPPTGQNTVLYGPLLGLTMTVFQTKLAEESQVFVSKFIPGQDAHRIACGGVKAFEDATEKDKDDQTTTLIVEVEPSESKITTLTGRLDITSTKGRNLLKEKTPIELHQRGPFVIDIVFGDDELSCPLRFPVPVTKDRSKTRIARTTGYIEVIAPLADPIQSACLADFMFPSGLDTASLPVALNTPHLNLDNLAILDLEKKKDMAWLTTLTSVQFSEREKRLRNGVDDTGISDDPRVNFKESLFTMFMLVSGLQGGQTGMFAINHPGKGGINMLIFASALRLDGDAGSVVLDAAVIPLTTELVVSGRMENFLLMIRSLECCSVTVNDEELAFWKKILPSLAERCRTWSHLPTCEFKKPGASVPLSLGHGEQVLCSCGNGKIPDKFITVPEWDSAAPHAVRIAISPTYSAPFVEDVINVVDFAKAGEVMAQAERCRNCGEMKGKDGGPLKKCTRCMEAKYCSAECQKKDWKKHRVECVK